MSKQSKPADLQATHISEWVRDIRGTRNKVARFMDDCLTSRWKARSFLAAPLVAALQSDIRVTSVGSRYVLPLTYTCFHPVNVCFHPHGAHPALPMVATRSSAYLKQNQERTHRSFFYHKPHSPASSCSDGTCHRVTCN